MNDVDDWIFTSVDSCLFNNEVEIQSRLELEYFACNRMDNDSEK
jgi:hypothetical protein